MVRLVPVTEDLGTEPEVRVRYVIMDATYSFESIQNRYLTHCLPKASWQVVFYGFSYKVNYTSNFYVLIALQADFWRRFCVQLRISDYLNLIRAR